MRVEGEAGDGEGGDSEDVFDGLLNLSYLHYATVTTNPKSRDPQCQCNHGRNTSRSS